VNKFFFYIDKFKFGIIAVFAMYIGIFVYLQMKTYTQYFPIQSFFEEPALEIPKEEVEVKPENIEVPSDFKMGELKNVSRDMNDTRERSNKDWYQNKSTSDVEQSVKDYEKRLYEESGGEAKRKAIQKEIDERKKQNTNKSAITPKDANTNTQGGNKAAAGSVMVDWSLSGRTAHQNNNWYVRNPGYTCGYGSSGKVSVQITVNQNGDVIIASATGSSGANDCMIQQALKYAKLSRFNYSSSASKTQSGTIIYTFVGQ
jgi:outer membrane biosynthesis protein TonB